MATTRGAPLVNAMSVDVEEYFQVSAFENYVDRGRWAVMPSRVEASVERILALFELAGIKATFFTLGWIAERYPRLVQAIAAAGHEIASHGMNHTRATEQSRDAFYADVVRARALLADVAGQPVRGYRAASFSIDRRNPWAHEALAEAGYSYSSSVYPGRHSAYGMPDAPRFTYGAAGGALVEIPVTTVAWGRRRFPCAGGGFFRLYPYALTRAALARVNRRDKRAVVFYLHPWEVDPEQPRVPRLDWTTHLRHYLNLDRVEPRLRRLLTDFSWDRVDRAFSVPA